jgi:hypothetical protein
MCNYVLSLTVFVFLRPCSWSCKSQGASFYFHVRDLDERMGARRVFSDAASSSKVGGESFGARAERSDHDARSCPFYGQLVHKKGRVKLTIANGIFFQRDSEFLGITEGQINGMMEADVKVPYVACRDIGKMATVAAKLGPPESGTRYLPGFYSFVLLCVGI